MTGATTLSAPRAIGFSVAFFGLGIVVATLAGYLAIRLGVSALPAEVIAELVGFGLATFVIGVRVLHLDAVSLRYRVAARGRAVALGLGLGAVPAVVAMALAVPAGGGWRLDGGTVTAWLASVSWLVLLLAPAAFAEELIFRGVPLVALSERFGRWPALAALSVLFGLAHLGNANVTALAVLNVALAGVFLSLCFFLPGGIWTATGAHLGWNLTLAALAAPVSGLPFAIPFLDYRSGGPEWLTGGAFGPEGGACATLVLAAAVAFVARRAGATRTA